MINYNYLSCTDYDGNTKEINFCSQKLPESASADCTYLALYADTKNSKVLHVKEVDLATLQQTVVSPLLESMQYYINRNTDSITRITDSITRITEELPWKSNKIYKANMEFYANDIVLPDGKTTVSFCFSSTLYFSSLAYIAPRSFSKDSYGDFISILGGVATQPWLLNGSPITLNNTGATTNQPEAYPACKMLLSNNQIAIFYRTYIAGSGYTNAQCVVPISSFGNGDVISLSISEA